MVALSLVAINVSAQNVELSSPESKDQNLEIAKSMEIFFNLFTSVNMMYVDSTDPDKMITTAIDAMLEELDPYTEYISEQEMADFDFMTTGQYAGIGSLIRQRGEWVEISEPYAGSPSDLIGLKAGDRLLEIDGESLKGLGSEKVSARLKGEPQTSFTLKYRPVKDTTTTVEVEITRQRITIPSVPYYGMLGDSVGYIRFTTFTSDGAEEVRGALESLMGENDALSGLVIDLRGNGGGVVSCAVDIAGLFLPRGTLITTLRGKTRQSNHEYSTKKAPVAADLPLVVLIDQSSASASEILAGAMQDYDRGVVIGNRSFGKGLVQAPKSVSENAMVKVTIAKYYTPSGRCIQAIDYTHRNDDGSVKHIPDSLVQEFITSSGRKVYDGGGINPDIKIEDSYLSKFGTLLMAFGFLDDFSNLYAAQNEPEEMLEFVVDDRIYSEFVAYMQDKTIDYTSPAQSTLEELRKFSKFESHYQEILPLMDSIEAKLADDKNALLVQHQDEIEEMLATSIITRWYYSRGALEYSLATKDDKDLQKAIEILIDRPEYTRILTEQDTSKN